MSNKLIYYIEISWWIKYAWHRSWHRFWIILAFCAACLLRAKSFIMNNNTTEKEHLMKVTKHIITIMMASSYRKYNIILWNIHKTQNFHIITSNQTWTEKLNSLPLTMTMYSTQTRILMPFPTSMSTKFRRYTSLLLPSFPSAITITYRHGLNRCSSINQQRR